MFHAMSLRTKLLIVFVVLALIPLFIAGRRMIDITRNELRSTINNELLLVADQIAAEIDAVYEETWRAPLELMRSAVDNPNLGPAEKVSLLTSATSEIPDLVAVQLTVEGISPPALALKEPFELSMRSNGLDPTETIVIEPDRVTDLAVRGVERIPSLQTIEALDTKLMTMIIPLDRPIAGRRATLAARFQLPRFRERIVNHPFRETASIRLIDSDGRTVFEQDSTLFSASETVRAAVRQISENGARIAEVSPYVNRNGRQILGAFAPSLHFDWAVVVEMEADKAYEAVNQLEANLLMWLIVGGGVAVIGGIFFTITLTHPLRRLTGAARNLAGGDLTTRVAESKRRDEIGQLASTFNAMVRDLNRYIEDLTETTREKERVESELKLAHDIQQSFLIKNFPDDPDLEFYGVCYPAREVGGDYYDYIQLDDQHYGFVIGDVSGKGPGAALFMAVGRTLFRLLATVEKSPDVVLSEFNNWLCRLDNGANLFITVFYGVLNRETGRMRYSTAGHNMPLLGHRKNGLYTFEALPRLKTMVAGMLEDIPLGSDETTLVPGDVFVLYTDGLTEAENEKEEEYGEKRLRNLLGETARQTAEKCTEAVIREIKDYQIGRPQFDDMTMFTIRYQPEG
ncbi:SpoIIE family protein phosphatase [bacterium]|nr:SpoIIE family protein phosphatase [bacterium]